MSKCLSAKNIFLSCLCLVFLFPLAVSAARLYLEPISSGYRAGDNLILKVKLDTEGEAINAVEAILSFPKDFLKVIDVDKKNSFISLWLGNPFYSNEEGSVSFGGGLPTPGYNGREGLIGTIIFKAQEENKINLPRYFFQSIIDREPIKITIKDNSAVILNNGRGAKADLKIVKGEYHLIFSQQIKLLLIVLCLLIVLILLGIWWKIKKILVTNRN